MRKPNCLPWLKDTCASQLHAKQRRARTALSLETLEDRTVPALVLSTFDPASGLLNLQFDDARDTIQITFDYSNNHLVQLQQDPNLLGVTSGPYLLVNGGQTVSMDAVKEMRIDLGGGDDLLYEPQWFVPLVRIYGGAGNDNIKIAVNHGTVYAYGGTGDDLINAEHSHNNFLYGGDGNDVLFGSTDGQNYLDGGSGTNQLYPWVGYLQGTDPSTPQMVVYHQGANDQVWDSGGGGHRSEPTIYDFVSDGSSTSGSLYISDPRSDLGPNVLD